MRPFWFFGESQLTFALVLLDPEGPFGLEGFLTTRTVKPLANQHSKEIFWANFSGGSGHPHASVRQVDLLLVTHFHLDHSGAVPWGLQRKRARQWIFVWLLDVFGVSRFFGDFGGSSRFQI